MLSLLEKILSLQQWIYHTGSACCSSCHVLQDRWRSATAPTVLTWTTGSSLFSTLLLLRLLHLEVCGGLLDATCLSLILLRWIAWPWLVICAVNDHRPISEEKVTIHVCSCWFNGLSVVFLGRESLLRLRILIYFSRRCWDERIHQVWLSMQTSMTRCAVLDEAAIASDAHINHLMDPTSTKHASKGLWTTSHGTTHWIVVAVCCSRLHHLLMSSGTATEQHFTFVWRRPPSAKILLWWCELLLKSCRLILRSRCP